MVNKPVLPPGGEEIDDPNTKRTRPKKTITLLPSASSTNDSHSSRVGSRVASFAFASFAFCRARFTRSTAGPSSMGLAEPSAFFSVFLNMNY